MANHIPVLSKHKSRKREVRNCFSILLPLTSLFRLVGENNVLAVVFNILAIGKVYCLFCPLYGMLELASLQSESFIYLNLIMVKRVTTFKYTCGVHIGGRAAVLLAQLHVH